MHDRLVAQQREQFLDGGIEQVAQAKQWPQRGGSAVGESQKLRPEVVGPPRRNSQMSPAMRLKRHRIRPDAGAG